MPRRNLQVLVALTFVCVVCSMRVSHDGSLVNYAMAQIRQRSLKEVSEETLLAGALDGMLGTLDHHSRYITPRMIEEFNEGLDQQFGGIGVEIFMDSETKRIAVLSPLPDSPAMKAGLRVGDVILMIDQTPTDSLSMDQARNLMRGETGQPIVLTVRHRGESKPARIEIVRAVIHTDSVIGDTRKPDGSWEFMLEGHDRIGYLRIETFGEETVDELARAVEQLTERNMRGLILDLRDNPGGLLQTAAHICDQFVQPSVNGMDQIVSTRFRNGMPKDVYFASKQGTHQGFPIAVLVNADSASASEIVAACLQDYGRGVVVGQRTFGKGTVQDLIELGDRRGILKLTTASYWRPSGKNIHRSEGATESETWGVKPNDSCEVIMDVPQRRALYQWQLRRALRRMADEPTEPDVPRREVDPQLDRAIQHVEEAAARSS